MYVPSLLSFPLRTTINNDDDDDSMTYINKPLGQCKFQTYKITMTTLYHEPRSQCRNNKILGYEPTSRHFMKFLLHVSVVEGRTRHRQKKKSNLSEHCHRQW